MADQMCENCGDKKARRNYKGRHLCISCEADAKREDAKKTPPSKGGKTFKWGT